MKTIVLIDEDLGQRNQLAGWLAESGWRVLMADDGERGLELILKHRPEMVVCDLLMPRCNGFQLCRMIRKEETLREHTKVIVTTGGGYSTDRLSALEAGADEYVVKPIQQLAFMRLVGQLMGDWDTARFVRQTKTTPEPTPTNFFPFTPVIPREQPAVVRFWGVRGSIPTPGPATLRYGGNTSCVEVRAEGQIIILDAGSGIAPLGARLTEEFGGRPFGVTVLISHTHWDHIQGFPFFEPAYNPKNRVQILGYKGAKEGLQSTLSGQMESPYFPVTMSELPSNIAIAELRDLKFSVGDVQVEATYLNHPGLCMGYRLSARGVSVAYLPDNEPYQRFKYHYGKPAESTSPEAIDYARKQDQRIIDFVQGADVLIIDSQYDATEYQSRIGWGHGCVDDVVALALSAKVKRLFLFHHDPRHNDVHLDKMAAWARNFIATLGEDLQVAVAQEGLEVVLHPSRAKARTKDKDQ